MIGSIYATVSQKLRFSLNCLLKVLALCWTRPREFVDSGRDDNPGKSCPRADTVLLSLFSLLIFLVTAICAILYPTIAVKHFIIAFNAALAGILSAIFTLDMIKSKITEITT
jgi:hypothetical protein